MTHNPFSLEGRTALVTGANRGLGRAFAQALAVAGADVVVVGRDDGHNRQAATEIADSTGRRATVQTGDVTRPTTLPASSLVRSRTTVGSTCS